ncbi:YybH family protein [Leptothrix sp. BB-4]
MKLHALFTVEYNVPVRGAVKRRIRLRERALDAVLAVRGTQRPGVELPSLRINLQPSAAVSRAVWMGGVGLAVAMVLVGTRLTSEAHAERVGALATPARVVPMRASAPVSPPSVATVVAPVTAPVAAAPAADIPGVDVAAMESRIRDAVENWAEAWSRRDVAAYLASYADHYAGPAGDRNNWERERRYRIESRRLIRVELSDIEVERDADKARVTFLQRYRSDALQETTRKTLTLERVGQDRWLIVRES